MFVSQAFAQTESPDVLLPPASPAPSTHGEIYVEEGHEGGFPPFETEYFPSQLLWLAITFGIFYLVLKKVILPRIAGILENRRDRIALDLEAADRMRADADEAQAAYEQELTEARDRAHGIALEAKESARTDAESERKRIDGELDGKLGAAQVRIDDIKREALKDVGSIAEEATDAILREVARIEAPREEIAGAVTAVRS
ncbi:F0F1 ATP synthase subunit B [Aurantimonas aggregata]|uniref:ATP synthase subunit b n=1 Tax=Aurantimonas aggregata TaxID=2047720 RepID=A0A6L9MDW3_9HYPH|nr:F0F1 ATP synthase subunit B [Aurantimonas aggregata]NDV86014.1 F0F1 ATP synthase subunit B [Aurantimonas aggregata]